MSTAKDTQQSESFSAEEKAAMKERAREAKAEAKAKANRDAGESDLLAKIAEMPEHDRMLATRLHEIISENAPDLWPKTWYGQPAYAIEGKSVVCFFQAASKFNTRYATLGFQHDANLDDGNMWPTSFAVIALTPADEERIAALVRKAVS